MDKSLKTELESLRKEILTNITHLNNAITIVDEKLTDNDIESCLEKCPRLREFIYLCKDISGSILPTYNKNKLDRFNRLLDIIEKSLATSDDNKFIEISDYIVSMSKTLEKICKKQERSIIDKSLNNDFHNRLSQLEDANKVQTHIADTTNPVLKISESVNKLSSEVIEAVVPTVENLLDDSKNIRPSSSDTDKKSETVQSVNELETNLADSNYNLYERLAVIMSYDTTAFELFSKEWNENLPDRVKNLTCAIQEAISIAKSHKLSHDTITTDADLDNVVNHRNILSTVIDKLTEINNSLNFNMNSLDAFYRYYDKVNQINNILIDAFNKVKELGLDNNSKFQGVTYVTRKFKSLFEDGEGEILFNNFIYKIEKIKNNEITDVMKKTLDEKYKDKKPYIINLAIKNYKKELELAFGYRSNAINKNN